MRQNIERWAILDYLKGKQSYDRLPYPVLLDSCKVKGYKQNNSFTVLAKITKGSKKSAIIKKARKPSLAGKKYDLKISNLEIAKNRTSKRYKNLKLVNGHFLLHHAGYNYYQIIL